MENFNPALFLQYQSLKLSVPTALKRLRNVSRRTLRINCEMLGREENIGRLAFYLSLLKVFSCLDVLSTHWKVLEGKKESARWKVNFSHALLYFPPRTLLSSPIFTFFFPRIFFGSKIVKMALFVLKFVYFLTNNWHFFFTSTSLSSTIMYF